MGCYLITQFWTCSARPFCNSCRNLNDKIENNVKTFAWFLYFMVSCFVAFSGTPNVLDGVFLTATDV